MNFSLDTLRSLDANKSYYLAQSTGRITEASAWHRFKCWLGVAGSSEKSVRLLDAVKASLLETAGMKSDAALSTELAALDTSKALSGRALKEIASRFSVANAARIASVSAKQISGLLVAESVRNLAARGASDPLHARYAKDLLLHAIKPLLDHPPTTDDDGRQVLDPLALNMQVQQKLSETEALLEDVAHSEALGFPKLDAAYAEHLKTALWNPDGTRTARTIDDLTPAANVRFEKALENAGDIQPQRAEAAHAAIRTALAACGDDPDAADLVVSNISRFIENGAHEIRDDESIQQRVKALKDTFAELRQLADKDTELMDQLRSFMKDFGGSPRSAADVARVVRVAKTVPIAALEGLQPGSGPADIHKAVRQLRDGYLLATEGIMEEAGEEKFAWRKLALSVMLSRLERPALRAAYGAVSAEGGAKLLKLYNVLGAGQFPAEDLSDECSAKISANGQYLSVDLALFDGMLEDRLGLGTGSIRVYADDIGPDETWQQGVFEECVRKAQSEVEAEIQAAKNAPSEIVRNLDELFLQAAKKSTVSLNGNDVESALKPLCDQGFMTKVELRSLKNLANVARNTLRRLDRYSGADLAAAFSVQDGKVGWDDNTQVAQDLKTAIDAQQELSARFVELDKRVESYSRHFTELKQQDPTREEADPEAAAMLGTFRLASDRRASEVASLAYRMYDYSLQAAAQGEQVDPAVRKALSSTVADLLPRQALEMHGTTDLLTAVNENLAAKLRPVALRIDEFSKNPAASLTAEDILSLEADLARMRAALEDVRRNGVEIPGREGRAMVAADLVGALETAISDVSAKFAAAKRTVVSAAATNLVQTVRGLFRLTENTKTRAAGRGGTAAAFNQNLADFLAAIDRYAEAVAANSSEASDRLHEAEACSDRLYECAFDVTGEDIQNLGAAFQSVLHRTMSLPVVFQEFLELDRIAKSLDEGKVLTGAEAKSLFSGSVRVSSLVETRLRGLRDTDVDPATDDSKLVSAQRLGGGNAGDVHLLTFEGGVQRVFKGETEGRSGLSGLTVGSGRSYNDSQQTAALNIASCSTAQKLGFGHLYVNYTVGTHNGVFGFYMELAPGMSADDLRKKPDRQPANGLSATEIKNLPPAERARVHAKIRQELNRLQWLDLITGQNDRHWNNYFVHVDRTTHAVTVKAIDNDASFSQVRVGALRYALDETKSKRFLSQLRTLAADIAPQDVEAELRHLKNDPGVHVSRKGLVTVDIPKLQNKGILSIMSTTAGLQTTALPERIDRQMYDSLMALKNDRAAKKALLDDLADRLTGTALAAARTRLDDVIAHADRLGKEGKVVDDAMWDQVVETPYRNRSVTVTDRNGAPVQLPSKYSAGVNVNACPAYYTRDFIDRSL